MDRTQGATANFLRISGESRHDEISAASTQIVAPVLVFFSRRYCNQLAHRRAASATGPGSCPGLTCELAFPSAYDTLTLLIYGDHSGTDGERRSGRIDSWKDREFADEDAFAAAVRGECSAPGRMTDVFRAWCADRGLPQRARLPKGGADALESPIRKVVDRRQVVVGESTMYLPVVWAEALYWDAAQTGLSDPIDSDRVQRWFTSLDHIVGEIEEMDFTAIAYDVDAAFAAEVPAFHAAYLQAAREQTRLHERFDGLETDGSGRWWRRGGRQ